MVRLQAAELEAVRGKIRAKQALGVRESCGLLVEGYMHFQERMFPSSLTGVNFIRVAGQAVDLANPNSRSEIRRMLNNIRTGGAFLILGHGGMFPCGAVSAKQAAVALESRGERLDEPDEVRQLVDAVSPNVAGVKSPRAELNNATDQAKKILADPEFSQLIARKNITVVVGVFCSDDQINYRAMNRDDEKWNDTALRRKHPKLQALCDQLRRALNRVMREQIDMAAHYSHVIFVFDPFQMMSVLDPFNQVLEVGGISCVDARLSPNVPGARYLFRPAPNQTFAVTIERNGSVRFSGDDLGSVIYALRHVGGVRSLKGDGNGHIVCLDTSISCATQIRSALLENALVSRGTLEGQTITVASFDGRSLQMINEANAVHVDLPYAPHFPILTE